MTEEAKTYDGPDIPLEMQALTLMKYYRKAVALCAANIVGLYKRVEASLGEAEEMGKLAKALEDDPVYMRLLGKLAQNYELFGDKSFRMSVDDLKDEVVDEMDDMITWMAFMLWVENEAEFPEWMWKAHAAETESDEEE